MFQGIPCALTERKLFSDHSSMTHIIDLEHIAFAPVSAPSTQYRSAAGASSAPHFATGEPVLEGEVLDKDDEPIWQQEPTPPLPEIGAVINKALRAAGLLKG